MRIEVTQEDLEAAAEAYSDSGIGLWTQCCPIAQALKRECPGYDWRVDPTAGRNLWVGHGYDSGTALPLEARRFARKWDRTYKQRDRWPSPIAFEVTLPPLPETVPVQQ